MTEIDDRFAGLVARPDADIPLDEAALLIAAGAYPDLDVGEQLVRLDELAAACPEPTLDGLRRHLFDEVGLPIAFEARPACSAPGSTERKFPVR